MSAIIATVAQMANVAIGLGGSPLAIAGLLPVFAIALTYMRYARIDPESHPINVRRVSSALMRGAKYQNCFPDAPL